MKYWIFDDPKLIKHKVKGFAEIQYRHLDGKTLYIS